MLSRGGGRVWNAQYRRVDSSRAFLVEYSTLGILVNNSGFWMSMEWFGRMQYCQVHVFYSVLWKEEVFQDVQEQQEPCC